MKAVFPPTANPAITYNPVENAGVFQRVPSVSGVSGPAETLSDPWKTKLPPKCGQASAVTTEASPSRPSPLPPLVPLESPWIDGQRYREAGATELATRLVLFVADPAGPWVRRHGVLLAHSAVNRATNSLAGP